MGYFLIDGVKFDNRFVNGGRMYALDAMWNISTWNASPAITMRVGTSTDTNAGTVGPTNTTYVSTAGSWQGVDPNDYKLSSEASGVSMSGNAQIVRVGKTVHIYADIINSTTSDVNIYEIGMFLGSGVPVNNPANSNSATDLENVMICRAIRYYTVNSGTEYKADYVTVPAGSTINIAYVFNDFEG